MGGDWYVWGAVRVCVACEYGMWHISISCEYRYPTWDEIYTAWYDLVPGAGDIHGAIILPRKSEYVNIHPNPSDGNFTVSVLSEQMQEIRISIHDLLGNEVFNRSYPPAKQVNIPFDMHEYPKGMYLVSVISINGSVVKKIMIR